MNIFRAYEPCELEASGYPPEWRGVRLQDDLGIGVMTEYKIPAIKDLVREQAGHRCVRCHHPYECGKHGSGEWSPCDEQCFHGGAIRWTDPRIGSQPYHNGIITREADDGTVKTCLRSWIADGFEIEARWRILTVHHLDGDKANCRWWNLAALCQRCHLTIQGRVVMARVWPWEHSDWFKPYVAGYYAWTYLGEDVTREEVDARLDELLALERSA